MKGADNMKLENLIAKGTNNEVYKSGDIAVKVFGENYPKADVLNEALIASRVEETGINIPKIKEVSVIDGKWAIAMDYIEGKTLADYMKEDPANIDKYIEQMVDIQLDMHSKKCPMLGKLKDKLYGRIDSLDIEATKKYELLTRLDSAPKHKKLCHGDFNPQNIIISDGKPYIIDWNHATRGNASADVARSYLWLCLYMPEIADKYIDKFCEKSGTDKTYVQRWLPVVAAARLSKHIPEEKDLIEKWIDVVEYE